MDLLNEHPGIIRVLLMTVLCPLYRATSLVLP